jgi:anti-anti-sigma regulatory factor/HAMP domain-containing protein
MSRIWHDLSLRTRILIGYGLLVIIAVALSLFYVSRVNGLSQRIGDVNQSVAAEATAGAALAARAATVQQLVDIYLRQPEQPAREAALASLTTLEEEIARQLAQPATAAHRERLATLDDRLGAYRETFEELSGRLEEQRTLRAELNTTIFRSISLITEEIRALLPRREGVQFEINDLLEIQSKLQLASLWIDRLTLAEGARAAQSATDELRSAQLLIERSVARSTTRADGTSPLRFAAGDTTLAISLTTQLAENLAAVDEIRTARLTERARLLAEQADALASRPLAELTTATSDIEGAARGMQDLAGVALPIAIIAAVIAGQLLANMIIRPVHELLGATKRINDGDYAVRVAQHDGSEIGLLAASFNQMTATLAAQRSEVASQQQALVERNRAVEQALAELQAANEARDALADTVRAMSVPVLPILDRVIVVPLVGTIDVERAEILMQRLLAGVASQRARIAILDVTGVPFVDEMLADHLLKAAAAVELLGARCVLVGISPEVAQALVAAGVDAAQMQTRADLRDAVRDAMRGVR